MYTSLFAVYMGTLRCYTCENVFPAQEIRIIEYSNETGHIDEYLTCMKCDADHTKGEEE